MALSTKQKTLLWIVGATTWLTGASLLIGWLCARTYAACEESNAKVHATFPFEDSRQCQLSWHPTGRDQNCPIIDSLQCPPAVEQFINAVGQTTYERAKTLGMQVAAGVTATVGVLAATFGIFTQRHTLCPKPKKDENSKALLSNDASASDAGAAENTSSSSISLSLRSN